MVRLFVERLMRGRGHVAYRPSRCVRLERVLVVLRSRRARTERC